MLNQLGKRSDGTYFVSGNVVQDDLPVAVAGHEKFIVGRVRAVGDGAEMFQLQLKLQLSAVQRVDVNLVVTAADGDFLGFRVDGHAACLVADRQRQRFAVVLHHDDLRHTAEHHDVLLLQDVHAAWLARQLQVHARVRVALDVDLLQRVVDAAGVHEVAMRLQPVHLVAVSVAFHAVVRAVAGVPVGDGTVMRGGVNDAAVLAQRHGGDGLVVSFDDALGLGRIGQVEIVDEAGQRDGEDVLALPQARHLLILHGIAHEELGQQNALLHVPQLASLVTGHRQQLRSVGLPRDAINAAFVSRSSHFAHQVRRVGVVDENLAVEAAGREELAVLGVPHDLNEARVILLGLLELERRTFEDSDRVVLTAGDDAEGPDGSEIDAVDGLRLTADLADGRAGVGHEDVPEALAALANHDDALAVSGPGDILDGSTDRLELVLQQVLLVHRVPDADLAGGITRRNVEAGRRIFGNVDSAGMLRVDLSNSWILKLDWKTSEGRRDKVIINRGDSTHINISDDHRISVGVKEVLAARIAAQHDRLAAAGSRQASVNKFCWRTMRRAGGEVN